MSAFLQGKKAQKNVFDLNYSGFGTTMIDAPIVLLYTNSTGQTIVSQLLADAYVTPLVDPKPPRIATAIDAFKSVCPLNAFFAVIDWFTSLDPT